MRRIISLFILSLATVMLMANPVEREKARANAARFLSVSKTAKVNNVQMLEKRLQPVEAGFSHLHIFNNGQNDGFVVVSADDRTDEVLAYSEGGSFGEVPVDGGIHEILADLNSMVAEVSASNTFTSRNDTEFQEQDRAPIYPMITNAWNQYDPYYHFCPLDPNTGKRTLVGCVAISLAQIMKYYEYPKQTTINIPAYTTSSGIKMPKLPPTTFEYNKMLDYYVWDGSIEHNYTTEQLEAVQKLLKYAGCAMKMEYSSGGSASTFDINLINKYFDYRKDAKRLYAANYPRATWEEMVYNELAAGRPVPYTAGAVLQQNHQFVIDGYDGHGYFHANTGEYGYYSGLFYCKLHVINDTETQLGGVQFSGYNVNQSAFFNFQPNNSTQPLQDLPAGEDMTGKLSKLSVNNVHFYNPYVGEKTVAVVNISNQGETYENTLLMWMGETLIGGVGTYVPPGQSGDIVICVASPYTTGKYPVRFTTDWEGKNVVYEANMEIIDLPDDMNLLMKPSVEGYKGMFLDYMDSEHGTVYFWNWDTDWQYEAGIYGSLKIEADITNSSKNRYNSWVQVNLFENNPPDENGNPDSGQGKEIVHHIYYLDLAPGETKHYTFYYDKNVFNAKKVYFYRIRDRNKSLFNTPSNSKFFTNLPGEIIGDADNDGKINMLDVTNLINYILNKKTSSFFFVNADVNGDGLINMLDVTGIIDIILK